MEPRTDEPVIIIGEREGWGDPRPFGISTDDQRQHIYVIGKTGSGKTTLLRNLIIQHIALGHGVGVIDPHGDLAEELSTSRRSAPIIWCISIRVILNFPSG